jgi:hypothetical protein
MLQINVTEDQVFDCVEESLKFFADYHYDGSEHVYYTHILTQEDIDTRSFTVPESLISVVDIYSSKTGSFASSLAQAPEGYQFMVDLAFNVSSGSLVTYYMNQQYYNLISQVLYGMTAIRFNRHTNKVHIDNKMSGYAVGDIVIVDGYNVIDPDSTGDVWNDRWLIKYCTAKIKRIWGTNVSKFVGMQLPGGVQFDGTKLLDDANAEIQSYEDEIISNYSLRPRDQTG